MTWVRLDDNIFGNGKFASVSPMAKLLHLAGICHSAQNLLDGRLSAQALRVLHAQAGTKPKHVVELAEARLWHQDGDAWLINDYLEYNPSREKVLADRGAARARKDKWRGNASRDASRTPSGTLPRPDPSRPGPLGTGTETNQEPAVPMPDNVRSLRSKPKRKPA